ncbi:NAD(P)-dependent alcohol dehydrogenase [Campylobacter lanienae]|uniref:NAD(P)-dependent alcohol dehydrogenase n=1 Tax=Campylobacter lanienae TaxID=75658 RepID=UPI000BB43F1C|nr:NAD(P)-dependent alcohol dehydrogenase [Campylobacter lanienae]
MSEIENKERREFPAKAAVAGVAIGAGTNLFGAVSKPNIACKGWAAFDESGELRPWRFERRAVGDDDILIEVMATSICHSDIHTELGHWGKQIYPQVPGHEIVGLVREVGKNVKNFKIGDRAGVGCMVDNTDIATAGSEEQYSKNTIFTYGHPYPKEPTGISQGGYSDYFVVNSHFAIHIPNELSWDEAAPLMCAGITTYSPIMKYMKKGDNVAIIGIGGLGHLGIKIAIAKGAKVTAFTTTKSKIKDIESWGAKAVLVKSSDDLVPFRAKFDFALSTIPYEFEMEPYIAMVKPFGNFTLVGMPINFSQKTQTLHLASTKVNLNASLIGGMKETAEMAEFCAKAGVRPNIVKITGEQINQAWRDVVAKRARYRFVIDPKSF